MERHIEVKTELCTGCKLCELACSAVKTGQFSPREARIKVSLVDIPEIPVPTLLDSCDYCFGNPICVRFCVPRAIVWKEMEARPARPKPSEAREIARSWLASVSS
ncbi:MAG: 4Fe-4S dicluster domain-containing protein [Chloroflexota bacterium]